MIKTNYFTYTGNGEHGMTATEYGNAFDALMGRNGTLVDSVFFQAYGENGALAKKAGTLFGMVGAGYDIKTDSKPDWHIDFKIYDADGDFSGQYVELDVNKGSAYQAKNFYVDPVTGDLVGLNANGQSVVIDGTLSADGTMLTYSIDNEVLQDITGLAGVVKGTFGGEHFGDNGASSFFEVKIS